MIPIMIKIQRAPPELSDPKSKVSHDLYNFKGTQAFGEFAFTPRCPCCGKRIKY